MFLSNSEVRALKAMFFAVVIAFAALMFGLGWLAG